MSKKQLHSRLKDLFSDLAEKEAERGQPEAEGHPGAGESEAPRLFPQYGPAASDNGPGAPEESLPEPLPVIEPVFSRPEPPQPSTVPIRQSPQTAPVTPFSVKQLENNGVAIRNGSLLPADDLWTEVGRRSLAERESKFLKGEELAPATIAVPFQMQGVGDLLLEIVDDSNQRNWSEDDRFMVMEIVSQLALALDNAQLYISAQQELAERVRAEQAILRRNRDLSTLNRIGQQLSRLTTRGEIFELLSTMVSEILDNRNLIIATCNLQRQTVAFPVFRVDGEPIEMPERPTGGGLADYAISLKKPLLVTQQATETLTQLGIDPGERLPLSLLAIPMVAGERPIGALLVQDFEKENAYDNLHVELLSTAVSQATTALENADLFQQMQNALDALENRERYQANVARGAAALTENGTKAMPDVLKLLGMAAQCSRTYFAEVKEDERGMYWSSANEWADPGVAYLFDRTRILHIPVTSMTGWAKDLRERGWTVTTAEDAGTPECEFIKQQHIRTTLVIAVPGKSSVPNLLAFDQIGTIRAWKSEEINALRVGADAIANTFVREDLLDQLQVSLDETENLYKASNRLALANDMQEMVAAMVTGVRSQDINRAILLLFEQDSFGKVAQITVGANWYSGRGTPPPPVGTEFPRSRFERFIQSQTPLFVEDIADLRSGSLQPGDQRTTDGAIDAEILEVLQRQNVRGLAVLPLWTGKRQTGVMMLQSEVPHRFTGREMRTFPPLADQMAIAVDNQRLFEQTQSSLAETELLYKVSNLVAQAANPKDMLGLVVENVLPEGADRASLFLIDSDANDELLEMELVGTHEAKGAYQQMGVRLPVTSLPLVKSLTDEPIIITDINEYPLDPASRKSLEQYQMNSSCLVPLRTSGRLIGVLTASSRNITEYDPEETRLLRIIGNGIAVALEKQRLLRQAQRRALELQTASEIARDTTSTLSLDLLLNRIVNLLSDRFGFYHASIFLMDETNTYIQVRESTGVAGQELKQRGHRLAVGSRSVVGTTAATGEPLILNDVVHSPLYFANSLLPDTRSEMGIPLKISNKVIGALDLQSRELNAFSQDDVTVLQILADQIAIAIENARAYELSQKAISDMREVDRVKSQFLANMSHELRTPLNSIIGFSRVILKGIDGPINDTQKQDLSAIYNSGQHLLSLINDILDLSKIEAGKMELAISEVNLVDMINSVMSTAAGLVKDKSIKLLTNIPDQLPVVRADATRTRQVLINFLSNAAKFTDEGSITVESSVITSPKGKPEVIISVTDTGPGIAPDDWGKLFLPFSQVDDSPTRKTGGTGLGLSICRSLIEMQGGRIGLLWSEVGKGSTFFFTIPTSEPAPHPQITRVSAPGSNVVLAVDDDSKVIDLYERYLKPHGYQVIPLTNPKQAVERAKEVHPFAITLDIMMPEKDGWQVMHDLKNDPKTRDIPIVICSIMENQEKGFSMGAADYLVKPFLQEDLINAINRLNRDGQISEVLVIDDDPADLRLVQKMLEENQKLHVSLAEGGKQGWEMIQSQRPHVIILDLFMPDLNGFAILENLRSNAVLREIPVIVLTGADLNPEQHKLLADFGQGLLAKGYLREKELLVILEEALRKFRPAGSEAQ